MNHIRIVAIIPTYNNVRTVGGVIEGVRAHLPGVIAVNDGSTDGTGSALDAIEGIEIITVEKNRGKGNALRLAFARATELGYTHAVTIDADGQHLPGDIPLFLAAIEEQPTALIIGDRSIPAGGVAQPTRSRLGARFGSFWYRFHTKLRINDTQCGFRCYPLAPLANIRVRGERYEYEIDVLIKAAWHKVPVIQIPIHLLYQPREERVSHFRPLQDFIRISAINSRAALTRIFMPWRFLDAPGETALEKLKYLFIKELTSHHSPRRASFSLALGIFIGLSPFHGFQMLMIVAAAALLRLNKTLALAGVTISSPPLVPFWIALQYWVGWHLFGERAMNVLAELINRAGFSRIAALLSPCEGGSTAAVIGVQWVLGSLVVSTVVATIAFAIAFPLLLTIERKRRARNCKL